MPARPMPDGSGVKASSQMGHTKKILKKYVFDFIALNYFTFNLIKVR